MLIDYTRYLSSCCFVGYFHSPQSHSYLCSWGFVHLPPRCNSKSIRYKLQIAKNNLISLLVLMTKEIVADFASKIGATFGVVRN